MTKLRTDFLAHLQLRGYAEATIKNYIQSVSLLAQHYNTSPLLLTAENIIAYLLHLRNSKKLAIRTYNLHFYSIKCFYEHFMPQTNMIGDLRRMKEPAYQPIVLSKQEAFAMVDAAPNLNLNRTIVIARLTSIPLFIGFTPSWPYHPLDMTCKVANPIN